DGVTRVNRFGVLIAGNRLRKMALAALHCGGVEADVTIIGKSLGRQVELAQSCSVVAFHVVMIKSKREMTFAEIRLQPQRLERFRIRLLFPSLCWLIEMVDGASRDREACVSKSKLWVERDRLLVKIRG